MFFVLVIQLLFCIGVGYIAQKYRGRSMLGWAIVSFFITPILTLIMLSMIEDLRPNKHVI